ncbi:MAG TPA: flagellar basal body-associated FliL family protein [Kofleriaceae bacterium]|nr:flagellar basal body-associated FliL family protein [Kofleriaceae bacterium]
MSDQPEGQPKPASGPKQKGSKLVVLLLLVNLGGTGFVAYQGVQMAGAAHAATPAAQADAEEEAAKKKNEVGPVTALEPFIVNLNEPDATRYLKATFELEVTESDVIGQLEKLKRPVRDEVLRYLSSLSVAETQGEAGKAKIQQEVVTRIDRQLGGNRVRRLFFVEFMVQ